MKELVIYHDHCTDGFAAAWAAWRVLRDKAEYLPMSYGATPPDIFERAKGRDVHILDFSFPRYIMDRIFAEARRVVWLDHHKTAFEMAECEDCLFVESTSWPLGADADGKHTIILDNNASGALLAWKFYTKSEIVPQAIREIDDRDRWQFKYPNSRALHAGLNVLQPWSFEQWDNEIQYNEIVFLGTKLLKDIDRRVQETKQRGAQPCRIKVLDPGASLGFRELMGVACNAPPELASELGNVLAQESGSYGLVWQMGLRAQINCSLRSIGDYDVSTIAKAFGGGGHRNAAGFSTTVPQLAQWIGLNLQETQNG